MSESILIEDFCNDEQRRCQVGDTVHYKMGIEKCGKIQAIDGDWVKVAGVWFLADRDLWLEG